MHEDLQWHVRNLLMNCRNLADRQLTGKDHPLETLLPEPAHLLRRTVVGLRGGMERDRGQGHPQDTHVLHEDGVHPDIVKLADELLCRLQLVVIKNRIHRDIDPHPIRTGIVTQLPDILHAITRSRPCAKTPCPDIDSISAMVDRRHSTSEVLGWCEQFEWCHRI